MTIEQLVSRFLEWCRPRRSPATVKFYRSRLSRFVEGFGDRELADLTPLDILAWLDEVNRGMVPDTQLANIAAFEQLQSWAVEHELIEKPVTTKKIEKTTGRRRERIPTAKEITAILSHASQEFRTIYQALRRSGARPNELCRATTADYDRRNQVIVLKDHKTAKKTGNPRIIVVGRQLAELIHANHTEAF